MKFNKEERLEIGRVIHESGLSNFFAGIVLDISEETARRYRILYERSQGIEHNSGNQDKVNDDAKIILDSDSEEPKSSNHKYMEMTKEELIEELMKSKVREVRLKKGYMVKGVGAEKKYITPVNKSSK